MTERNIYYNILNHTYDQVHHLRPMPNVLNRHSILYILSDSSASPPPKKTRPRKKRSPVEKAQRIMNDQIGRTRSLLTETCPETLFPKHNALLCMYKKNPDDFDRMRWDTAFSVLVKADKSHRRCESILSAEQFRWIMSNFHLYKTQQDMCKAYCTAQLQAPAPTEKRSS